MHLLIYHKVRRLFSELNKVCLWNTSPPPPLGMVRWPWSWTADLQNNMDPLYIDVYENKFKVNGVKYSILQLILVAQLVGVWHSNWTVQSNIASLVQGGGALSWYRLCLFCIQYIEHKHFINKCSTYHHALVQIPHSLLQAFHQLQSHASSPSSEPSDWMLQCHVTPVLHSDWAPPWQCL